MKAIKILLSVTLFLLIGCTAVSPVEESGETAVPPASTAPEEAPMNEDDISTTDPQPTPTNDDKQVSEPVTVDLGDVTAVPIETEPAEQPPPGTPVPTDTVLDAMNDLSQRLGVPAEEIELVSLQEVTWRDGSIGCPEAGVAYTQALVPGQQLILKVNGEEYHYHSGRNSAFSYCSDPVPPLESGSTNPLHPVPGQDD